MTVDFEFDMGQGVVISRTLIEGTVKALYVDQDDVRTALVHYADKTGKLHQQWIRFNERVAYS